MLFILFLLSTTFGKFLDFTGNPAYELAKSFKQLASESELLIRITTASDMLLPEIRPYLNLPNTSILVDDESTLYQYEDDNYYGTQFNTKAVEQGEWLPLTQCFSCTSPGGCVQSGEVEYSVQSMVGGSLEFSLSLFADLTGSGVGGVAHGYKISQRITCNLAKGEYGQIYLKPLIYDGSHLESFRAQFNHELNRFNRLATVFNRNQMKMIVRNNPLLMCRQTTSCADGIADIIEIK